MLNDTIGPRSCRFVIVFRAYALIHERVRLSTFDQAVVLLQCKALRLRNLA